MNVLFWITLLLARPSLSADTRPFHLSGHAQGTTWHITYYSSDSTVLSIDPHTGYPIDNELISVTVYAKKAIIADAYDNALMIMGLKKAMQFVNKRKDMAAFFIYRDKNGAIVSATSKSFNALLNP